MFIYSEIKNERNFFKLKKYATLFKQHRCSLKCTDQRNFRHASLIKTVNKTIFIMTMFFYSNQNLCVEMK